MRKAKRETRRRRIRTKTMMIRRRRALGQGLRRFCSDLCRRIMESPAGQEPCLSHCWSEGSHNTYNVPCSMTNWSYNGAHGEVNPGGSMRCYMNMLWEAATQTRSTNEDQPSHSRLPRTSHLSSWLLATGMACKVHCSVLCAELRVAHVLPLMTWNAESMASPCFEA